MINNSNIIIISSSSSIVFVTININNTQPDHIAVNI